MDLTLTSVMKVRVVRVQDVVVVKASLRMWLVVKHFCQAQRPRSHPRVRADVNHSFYYVASVQKVVVHLNKLGLRRAHARDQKAAVDDRLNWNGMM